MTRFIDWPLFGKWFLKGVAVTATMTVVVWQAHLALSRYVELLVNRAVLDMHLVPVYTQTGEDDL
jgi:hypothetical protein